jgi:hypothetical protein
MVTSVAMDIKPILADAENKALDMQGTSTKQDTFCVGQNAFIQLITLEANSQQELLESGTLYHYDLIASSSSNVNTEEELKPEHRATTKHEFDSEQSILKDIPGLTYEGHSRPNFRFNHHLTKVTQGSCRKPHFHGDDALPQLDRLVENELGANELDTNESRPKRPDIMLMSGDQVYLDDVAGPMLHAIHQVINLLGLHNEVFEGATVDDLSALMAHEHGFYKRQLLLPAVEDNDKLSKAFFAAKSKPVFTSVNAKNHLIALSEMLAMYMLCWSPVLWKFVKLDKPDLIEAHREVYAKEKQSIENFQRGLAKVQRALAHVPCYMIFDDHDVTDDWNLTRGWEEKVYGHPFSKRVVGNALAAYFLCQGCGNPKEKLGQLFEEFTDVFSPHGLISSTELASSNAISDISHKELIDTLFEFDQWHYNLATQPPVHVLDTRTQRWRSESSLNKPSGLMDWEALCELQQSIMGKESVIMVSAAPVYGVKFIETVQRIFTTFGGALIVDAENWMAHRGTASVMLNIFRHMKTPPNFIILSGDVHYSFVYDVSLRFRRNSPHITQFTSSGIHNEFPDGLLRWFDRLDRWFYGHRSPLNWLTKRRNMSVRQRKPNGQSRTLVNKSNIGVLTLNDNATQVDCALICSDGSNVSFSKSKSLLKADAKANAKAEQQ